MTDPKLVEYIKQLKAQGHSDQSIRDDLIQNGWQTHMVDEAFSIVVTPATTSYVPAYTPSEQPLSAPQQVERHKAPLFVIIVAWLMLIGGVFSLLGVLPFLLLGGFGKEGIIFLLGIINLIKGVGLVAVSFGIRYMRKWALYTFTVLTILAVVVSMYSFFTTPNYDFVSFADVLIQVLVLVYFWAVAKKFS